MEMVDPSQLKCGQVWPKGLVLCCTAPRLSASTVQPLKLQYITEKP